MSRPLRIQYEGAWYHVMNRGIARQPIYKTIDHRNIFLALLEEITKKFYIEIHAFCLMGNHYHLLLRTPIANLAKAMRHLNGLYTRRFNISQQRDGSIFRGRYQAILIEEEDYLIHVSRYIHLNPVKAKLSNNPFDYQWSSYRYYLNRNMHCQWLRKEVILSYFNSDIQLYADFTADGTDEELENFYNEKLKTVLGSDKFVAEVCATITKEQKIFCQPDINRISKILEIEKITEVVINYFSVTYNSLKQSKHGRKNLPRIFAIYFAKQYCQLTHKKISDFFTNINPRSVGIILNRLEKVLENEGNEIKTHFENLKHIFRSKC